MLGSSDIKVFLRLHPNIASLDTSSLVNDSRVVDVTKYPDMQELMCVADVLITDYSSSMFDFPLLQRPCCLYATDVEDYDRGFYYKFDELPFPLARTQEQLVSIIESFDADAYSAAVETFCKEKVGLLEKGTACE